MSVVSNIRKQFAADYPTLTRQEGDKVIELSADERDVLLDKWANDTIGSALESLRVQRNGLLAASDWTQAADAPVDAKAWAKYRQDLRDLPATIEDPLNPVWPSKP